MYSKITVCENCGDIEPGTMEINLGREQPPETVCSTCESDSINEIEVPTCDGCGIYIYNGKYCEEVRCDKVMGVICEKCHNENKEDLEEYVDYYKSTLIKRSFDIKKEI